MRTILFVLLMTVTLMLVSCSSNKMQVVEDTTDEQIELYTRAPKPLLPIVPEYPEIAMKSGMQGVVLLNVLVQKDGVPIQVDVARSIQSGSGGLDMAAIEAVKKARFYPAEKDGQLVDAMVKVPIEFKLGK